MTELKLEPGTEKPTLRDDAGVIFYRYSHLDGGIPCRDIASPTHWALERPEGESLPDFTVRVYEGHCGYRVDKVLLARPGQDSYELLNEVNQGLCGHPWTDEGWFRDRWCSLAEHMIDRSEAHPGLLSYYQSEDKRAANVRTPIKPGKYLRKFFSDVLSEDEIQAHGIAFAEWAGPTVVNITQDADEIEEAYVNGPRSCMSHDADDYGGPCHPARVYAGPDLALAYVGPLHKASARCVVWPDKLIYNRIYGDIHRMESALEAMGYSEGGLGGARVRRIEAGAAFVMPYVDHIGYADDDGDYLVLGDGNLDTQQTNGLSSDARCCADCGDGMGWHDDTTHVEGVGDVCEHCAEHNWFYCEALDEHVPIDDTTTLGTGETVSDWSIDYYDDRFFTCEGTDEVFCNRPRPGWNISTTERVVLADGTVWSEPYFDTHGANCAYSEERYDADDLVAASNGEMVHPDHLDDYEAELAEPEKRVEWVAAEVKRDVGAVVPAGEVPMTATEVRQRADRGFQPGDTVRLVDSYCLTELAGMVGTVVAPYGSDGHHFAVRFEGSAGGYFHPCGGLTPAGDGRYIEPHEMEHHTVVPTIAWGDPAALREALQAATHEAVIYGTGVHRIVLDELSEARLAS